MKLDTVEKFLLISHHPDKGCFILPWTNLSYGIIGAIFMEMSLQDKIDVDNNKLIVKNDSIFYNPIYSEVIINIRTSKKYRKFKYWIDYFSKKSNTYKWRFLFELEDRGIIKIEHKKFAGIIPYKKSYIIDKEIRSRLISQLKNTIIFSKELNNENYAIIGLIEACNMYKIISPFKSESKMLKTETKKILSETTVPSTIDISIKAVHEAILSAMVATILIST